MADSNISDEQRRHCRWVLYQVSPGLSSVAINHRAIQIALPTLTRVFDSDLSFIQWVLLVCDLCVIGLVLNLGRLGDLFGRKWIYVIGFLSFVTGSALCGAAQTSTQLVLFHLLQGIGGAMGNAMSGAITIYTLGANGLNPEQIESAASWAAAPEVFSKSFSFTAHWITAFAILSVVFAAMRGARKD